MRLPILIVKFLGGGIPAALELYVNLDPPKVGTKRFAVTLVLFSFTLYQPQGFECFDVSKHIFEVSISNLSQLADRRGLITTDET